MGDNLLPKTFINAESETPDAKKWNDNFEFLNRTQHTTIRNGDMVSFTASIPDSWTLNGAGAVSASDADSKRGPTAVLLTFGAADAFLSQASSEFKFFQGRKVRAWAFVKTSVANQARLRITDGVGSAVSGFHTGGGSYELLVVEIDVALGATELTIELHTEIAGSALFDAVTMADFNDIKGFYPHPADEAAAAIGQPTKEIFIHFPEAYANTIGAYGTLQIASAGDEHLNFRVPQDFSTIVSAVAIPEDTAGPQNVDLESNYAAPGEDATAANETDVANTYSYTANQMQELDISSVLTGIGANEHARDGVVVVKM